MELSAIKELIELDASTRKAVEDAHQMKFDLNQAIATEKKQLSDQMWKETNETVEKTKKEIDDNIHTSASDNEKLLDENAKKIKETFASKKDEWCAELVKRCID